MTELNSDLESSITPRLMVGKVQCFIKVVWARGPRFFVSHLLAVTSKWKVTAQHYELPLGSLKVAFVLILYILTYTGLDFGFLVDVASDKVPHETIKEKFGINMPQDFFDLWEFCKELNPQKPQGIVC